MGATTDLFPSMTLGSASAGEGITSENVSPMNLVYIRKVGYGVKTAEAFLAEFSASGLSGKASAVGLEDADRDREVLTALRRIVTLR
jgi:hypothetical protein